MILIDSKPYMVSSKRLLPKVVFGVATRDTQKYNGLRRYAQSSAHRGPTLKNVVTHVLDREIKQGTISSVEDDVAMMEIYQGAEAEIDEEQA